MPDETERRFKIVIVFLQFFMDIFIGNGDSFPSLARVIVN